MRHLKSKTQLSKKALRFLESMDTQGDAQPVSSCPNVAGPRRTDLLCGRGSYDGRELAPHVSIPDARMAAYKLPSRIGNKLYWPDGRVTGLNGEDQTC